MNPYHFIVGGCKTFLCGRSLLLSCFFSLFAASARAELSIQITQGIDNPIPIAVVPFAWEGSGVLSEDVGQIVINDLEQVGEFRSLSRSNMLSMPTAG